MSTAEYGAVLLLVAALAAVFTVVALPERVRTSTAAAICQLFSGVDVRDCPEDEPPPAVEEPPAPPAPEGPEGPPTAAGPVAQPVHPDLQAYGDAKKEADDAQQELDDLGDQSEEVKQEILDLLKDLVGITDIEDCLTKGDVIACISALAGLVPWGKVLKVLKKIPGAVKLAKKLKELWDKVADARARKKKADDALDDAAKNLDNKGLCKLPNSFPPGTPVLLADGSHRPIEDVRVGDLVWASDPAARLSGPRPVTHLITGEGPKRLVTLSTGPLPGATITATADHLFWRYDTGTWQHAADLPAGASLRAPDGRAVTVTASAAHVRVARVHNLSVAGLRSYHVLAGGTPVLVHNEDPCEGYDPEFPTIKLTNYRGRFNAWLAKNGYKRLPDDWDAHHRIPQEYRDHPEFGDFDFDSPSNIRGIPGSRMKSRGANVHQDITNQWAWFRDTHPNPTRAQIEEFAENIDRGYGAYWWRETP